MICAGKYYFTDSAVMAIVCNYENQCNYGAVSNEYLPDMRVPSFTCAFLLHPHKLSKLPGIVYDDLCL